ncbi:hypothetical protein BDY17DRAFT_254753 [Neohortaea acidophila]|uniref:Actin cytoskeleton-regulatory complex protein SLA1 n=1 Tax=Neohortaea acidophila TaxID=245834 RepID=A0A6A6PKQ8_9PEZI|nr:uncharacterized protein BDY17DRAFT_254753 [Neohortaea acidophila]KAF2480505.1 hypothetical protein BDY17DRAFT_254753 [Neohortaea acidophila]
MAYLGIYRALYDYAPQSEEELELHADDVLFVLEKSTEDSWWKCKKKAANDDDDEEPEGLVPNNYIEEATPLHTAKALYDYTKQTDEELSFKEDARLEVYDESDPDWTLVGCDGEYGFAPAIYIEPVHDTPAANRAVSPPPPMPPRPSQVDNDEPLPGEADYVPPGAAGNSPAAALAGILAQRTGAASADTGAQYTPEASEGEEEEEEEAPPPKPARPQSQASIPAAASPRPAPYTPSGTAEAPGIMPSPPQSPSRSQGGYYMYNIHEMVSFQNKSKKLPTTLEIDTNQGVIMISPEKSRDGSSQEWSAEKLAHYSIEGKHVFVELVRPSKSIDFHAGSKGTAKEIVTHLGELAGASRGGGLREVLEASKGSAGDGIKTGQMLYEFMAQGDDEVTVAAGDEVHILDDTRSEEWWMVKRLRNGKEGVVPSSYVEITGVVEKSVGNAYAGLNAGRSIVDQNRLEEERLTREAARKSKSSRDEIPERGSSLTTAESKSKGKRASTSSPGGPKSRPNQARLRTWTDRSGTFKVDAEFIGLRDGKIHLHKLNGVKIAVPVAKMSLEDIEYVERATGENLDDDKPLSDVKRRGTQKTNGTGAGASIDHEKQQKNEDYWFDFFLQCGIDVNIVGRYANAFVRDQMGPEIVPDINDSLLRTLGLKEGDILRVMKHIDNQLGRQRGGQAGGEAESSGDQGGLFSGPGGALRNNTRKGRPAPAVQTNDVVNEDAFKPRDADSSGTRTPTGAPEGAAKTPLASAPAREPQSGFEDDAWAVKPARTQTPEAPKAVEAPKTAAPPRPLINDDIASLSISTPALQPSASAPAPPAQSPPRALTPQDTAQPAHPPGADKAIFDKIASLAPARQRPQPPTPMQLPPGSALMAPPPRASSAPGFPPQQSGFGPQTLQPQLTGYASPQRTGYGGQQPQYQQQQQQPLQPQQTAFQYGGYQGQQPNGFAPQPTGIQAVQHNYPALQPQPTGLNFQPQSHFGQQQQSEQYGLQNIPYQPQYLNGTQTGSPFADPPRQPYQPSQPSGLSHSYSVGPPQQTGFQQQQQQQHAYSYSGPQPTGLNGYAPTPPPPRLPPQQTGGVFGPPQAFGAGLNAPPAPLLPQQTGPPPPVRFGVQPGQNKLVPQPTGRANLSKATPQNPFGF